MAEGAAATTGGLGDLPAGLVPVDDHPFVGRDQELQRLAGAWRVAQTGRPQLVVLSGEPGAGKTRLARRFARTVHEAGGLALFGRCDEEPLERYQPFVEALRALLESELSSTLVLPSDASPLVRVLPALAERLAVTDEHPVGDPETERYRLFEAFGSVLRTAAAAQPAVLVIDDVQWADQPTLLLLRHVVRQAPPFPLLVVVTLRSTDVGRSHPFAELLAELRRDEELVTRLDVPGLDADAVLELVTRLAGHGLGAAGHAFAVAVQRATGGNAFFVRETINYLADRGAVVQDERGRWVSRYEANDLPIPDGIREVIRQRVERLGVDVERTLVHAAVIGRRFDVSLLCALLEADEATVVDHLDIALEAELVAEVPQVLDEYTFAHALVRETLYATVSHTRRVRLHRLVGEELERRDDPPFAALARHFAAAPEIESRAKALDYAVRAARQAMDALAYEAAVSQYRRGLGVLDSAGDSAATARAGLLVELGHAQQLAGRVEHARESFRRAVELARQPGVDAVLLVDAALGFSGIWGEPGNPEAETVALLEEALERIGAADPRRRAAVLTRLSAELCFSTHGHRRAIELGHEAVAEAERSGDLDVITAARWQHRSMLGLPRDRAERDALGAEMLATNEASGSGSGIMSAHGWRLLDHLEAGRVADARADIDEYDALLRRLRLPFRRWYPTLWRATIALLEGRLDEAEALNAEAITVAGDDADGMLFTNWSAQVFALRFLQGRAAELASTLETVIEQRPGLLAWRAALALVLVDQGDTARARVLYDEVVGPGLGTLPYDVLWLVTCCMAADLAVTFEDASRAEEVEQLLAPFADYEVVAGYGAFTFGPVALRLGTLARLRGDIEGSLRWLEVAHERATLMGAEAWAAWAALEQAATLDRRGAGGDASRARALRSSVAAAAAANGWGLLAARARAAATASHPRPTPVSPW